MMNKNLITVVFLSGLLLVVGSGIVHAQALEEDKIYTTVFASLDEDGEVVSSWTVSYDQHEDGDVYTTTAEWQRTRFTTIRVHLDKGHMDDPDSTSEAEDLVKGWVEMEFYDEDDNLIETIQQEESGASHVEEEDAYHVVDIDVMIIDETSGHPDMTYGDYAEVTLDYRLITEE